MEMYKKSYFWPLVALCVVSLFLFLGQTFFNTRGEPREAVVALSMLQQGNWVLPVNNGVELAFKPPFFHWCIAAISTVAGAVNEYIGVWLLFPLCAVKCPNTPPGFRLLWP